MLHVSALGAEPDAPSEYLRSKAIGEQAVLAAEEVEATVFRPSVVFGREDRFLNQFARLARLLPVLAVPCPDAVFKPVYVRDVAQAMLASAAEPGAWGKRYDLCGPDLYRLKQLVKYVCAVTGRRRLVVGLSDRLSYLQASLMEWLPGTPFTRDNYRSMRVPNASAAPFPFGLRPQALEGVAPSWLAPLTTRERYPQLRLRARR
jgi:NADH dehydrogenase